MSIDVIQNKLNLYNCKTALDEENALKEIAQEIALLALSRKNFFRVATFQGGTSLRILYGLERFSEDLDFVLDQPDSKFQWADILNGLNDEFEAFGYYLEVQDRSKLSTTVQKAFLKTNSIGGLLQLKHSQITKYTKKINIKLEIDTNPPLGSEVDIKYLDFPLPFSIKTQKLSSLFAGKCHALLCREYVKGRDWYDFSWYITQRTMINYRLLANAIKQIGPWQGKNITVDKTWVVTQLEEKINSLDCTKAKEDIARFLKPKDLPILDLWSPEFFLSRLEQLQKYLV